MRDEGGIGGDEEVGFDFLFFSEIELGECVDRLDGGRRGEEKDRVRFKVFGGLI